MKIESVVLLEALETMTVTEPLLLDGERSGDPVTAQSWNDPLDTDLEHALGAVLIVRGDGAMGDEQLPLLGAYIVYESPEIAYDQLLRQLGPDPNYASMTVAGTKAWLLEEGEGGIAVFRIANVLVIAVQAEGFGNTAEGLFFQLTAVAASLV